MWRGCSAFLVVACAPAWHITTETCTENCTKQDDYLGGIVLLQRAAAKHKQLPIAEQDPVSMVLPIATIGQEPVTAALPNSSTAQDPVSAALPSASIDKNAVNTALRVFADSFNRHDFTYIDNILDEKRFRGLAPMPGMPANQQGLKYAIYLMLKGFPDLKMVIDGGYTVEPYSDGTFVCSKFTWTGTHVGQFMTFNATNVVVSVSGMAVLFLSSTGKLLEMIMHQDTDGLLRQLEAGKPCRDVAGTYTLVDGTVSTVAQKACTFTATNPAHDWSPAVGRLHGDLVDVSNYGIGTATSSSITYEDGSVWKRLTQTTPAEMLVAFVTMVINQHSPASLDLFTVPDFRGIAAMPGNTADRQGFKNACLMMMSGFPDLHVTLTEARGVDLDDVTLLYSKFSWTGTHSAVFMDIPATNRSVDMVGFVVQLMSKGKIVALLMHQNLDHLKDSLLPGVLA